MARMGEIGDTGLMSWSGVIQEDFLRELRGIQAYKRYDEMRRNSPIIGAMLLSIEQAIRSIDWTFVVGDVTEEEAAQDDRVKFLTEVRDKMSHSWNDHITEALTMLPFGYAPFEIVYQRDESGRITWRKFAFRGQDTLSRWEMDANGGLVGFWQQAPPTYQPTMIPIEKMVLYRIRVEKNNPEGRSMLRTAWIPYYYAKNIMQIEAIGVERDLAGLPKIVLPQSADTTESSTSDQGKAEKLVRRIRNDEEAGP